MNLHRVLGTADWTDIPTAKRNVWQRIAAATSGFVTIGNFFSLLGLASVPYGLWAIIGLDSYLWGATVLAVGRFCDLLDGWLADKTGTKSPLGEKIDASFDKAATAAVAMGLLLGGLLPLVFSVLLVAPHIAIAGVAMAAYIRGKSLHPSRAGKVSMAFVWVSITSAILARGVYADGAGEVWSSGLWAAAFVTLTVSFVLGVMALIGYLGEYAGVK